MKTIYFLLLINLLLSCNNIDGENSSSQQESQVVKEAVFGDIENPLYGKVFRNVAELPELADFSKLGGAIIDTEMSQLENFRFAIAHIQNKDNTHSFIFEELINSNKSEDVTFKILDTTTIGEIKDQEYLTYCNCRNDSIRDQEIVALVIPEDKEYYDRVVKAWRANRKTCRIEVIENTQGINCENEGYGLEGCGVE